MEQEKIPKILIVDDEPRNITLLDSLLGYLNYGILKAYNGQECLDCLKANPDIDLILLDIIMPEMDGYEVCRIIKSDESLKNIPVIFLTALSGDSNQVAGFAAGAVDYIMKPYKREILYARVKTHLELKLSKDKLQILLSKQEQLIEDLQSALANIKQLKSLLPICASCKKIRSDNGYWEQIDAYITKNTDTQFSHSICPDCAKKLYPDLDLSELYKKT